VAAGIIFLLLDWNDGNFRHFRQEMIYSMVLEELGAAGRADGMYTIRIMVVALIEGDQATVKRFYKEKGRIRLQPANPRYKPLILPPDQVRIQGIVVGIQREAPACSGAPSSLA
jgi:hypothetical protein